MDKLKEEVTCSKQKSSAQMTTDMAQIVLALNKITERLNTMDEGLNKRMEEEKKERAEQLEQIKAQNVETYKKFMGEINDNFAKYAAETVMIKDDIDQL